MIGGRYAIPAGTPMTVLSQALHHSTEVWGPDAAEFNPDHMAPDAGRRAPPERLQAVRHRASGRASDGSSPCRRRCWCSACCCSASSSSTTCDYQLKTKTTLTVKPDDFHIQVRPRQGVRIERGAPADGQTAAVAPATVPDAAPAPHVARHGTPLSVLFGSNLGTAEAIATRLAQEGTERGFDVTLGALDDHVDDLPRDGAAHRRVLVVQRHPAGQRRRVLPVDHRRGRRRHRGCGLHRLRLRQHRVGRDLPGRADPARRPSSRPTAARRVHARGEGNAAGDFDAAYRDWHSGLWADLAARARPAGRGGRRTSRPARGCRSR